MLSSGALLCSVAASNAPHQSGWLPWTTDTIMIAASRVASFMLGSNRMTKIDGWSFAVQDGTIQFEAKLTGCLSTSGMSPGEGPLPTHGTLVAPGLNAQIHQHFFCTRLDMAVDDPHGGANLTVSEVCASRCLPASERLWCFLHVCSAADSGVVGDVKDVLDCACRPLRRQLIGHAP